MSTPTIPKIGFVSLGCPKALVDSERIMTQLRAEGYQLVPTYRDADLVIVNTCGFIDAAVEESLNSIGEALAENGKVIVTGCLGAKKDLITARFSNVLSITGPQAYAEVLAAVHQHLPPRRDPFVNLVPAQGIKLTPRHYAYVKIAEGCNHHCSFCIIPSMRGKLVSRPIDEVMEEAQRLVDAGVRELLVISQDTSAYGVDLKYATSFWRGKPIKSQFVPMAEAMGRLGAWVRLHYVYPYPHVDALMPYMADGLVLPYLDIPFQHASPTVLRAMKRPASAENNLERIHAWRARCPDITLRSTFIVGFPGETDTDFETLLQFLQEARLDRVGCFTYSPVDGAAANALPNPVPEAVKQERYARFMETQQAISAEKLQQKVGKTLKVLIDSIDSEGAIGRSSADAPDIDGLVYIEPHDKLKVGEFAEVVVYEASAYDLYAKV